MMRFQINDGCFLNSTQTSLKGGTYHTAQTEAEEAELLKLAAMKTVTPSPIGVAPVQQAAPEGGDDDLAEVPGIGQSTMDKLAALKITKKSHLKAALTTMEADLKVIFGANFTKVVKHFA